MNKRNDNLCGPACRFRLLYEGTQASLADMAANHASQARRVGQIRHGVMGILRAAAPRRFNALEQHLGCRITEVDDDTFLSCVQWLLESNRDELSLSMLRSELSGEGYSWAKEASPAELLKVVQAGRKTAAPAPAPTPAPTAPAQEQEDLDDLFASAHADCPSSEEETPVETPKASTPPTPPARRKKTTSKAKAAKPEQEELDLDPASLLSQVMEEAAQEPTSEEESSEEESSEDATEEITEAPAADTEDATELSASEETLEDENEQTEESDGSDMFVDDMFADEPVMDFSDDFLADSEPTPPADEDDLFGDLFESSQEPTEPSEDSTEEEPAVDLTLPEEPAEEPTEASVETVVEEETPAPEVAEEAPQEEIAPTPRRVVRGASDRFTMHIPSGGAARSKTAPKAPPKRSKVSAMAPADTSDVTNDLSNKLTASVLLPRPMFVSDLAEQIGSAELVDQWVESERAKKTESEFRFVHGKDRYRSLGSLVIPTAEVRDLMDPSGSSWWRDCLQNFTGARLFELAVLLHFLGTGVSEVRVSDDAEAVTILTQSQRGGAGGVTAIVVSMRVDGTVAPAVLDAVATLSAGHYDMVMVLHTHDAEFDAFVAETAAALESRGVVAAMPIAASLNRCYVERDYSSVQSLL